MTTQLALFDYNTLDNDTRNFVQQRTGEIKALMKRTAQDIIEIGQRFLSVQSKLDHGLFLGWLQKEFEWSYRTAYRFISVAEKFDNLSNLEFAPSALYLLAAPSTPEVAREEALERAETGEPITHSLAKEIVAAHKEQAPIIIREAPARDPFADYRTGDGRIYGPEPRVSLPDVLEYIEYHPGAAEKIAQKLQATQEEAQSTTNNQHARQVLTESRNNEWYTPPEFLVAAREVMGGIDLDPASNPIANTNVQARMYYTIEDDGLSKPWHGRVFMNPPYGKEGGESNQARWTARLIEQYKSGAVTEAICLVNAVPGNSWFAPLWDYPICFPSRRIRFYGPDGEEGDPTFSNALVYFGTQTAKFIATFSQFGPVAARLVAYGGNVFIHGIDINTSTLNAA